MLVLGCNATDKRRTLVGRVESELPLPAVHDQTPDQVGRVDEDLGADEALPEVIWPSHLRHELVEQCRTSIDKDTIHHRSDLVVEGRARWPVSARLGGAFGDLRIACFHGFVVGRV